MTAVSPGTIVVIDDDEEVRESFTALLETRYLRVENFDSCGSFLRWRDGQELGCLVLDVHMPEMSGLDLLRALRGMGDTTPVVLMTGRNDSRLESQARALGVASLIDKPVNPGRLFQAIEQALASP